MKKVAEQVKRDLANRGISQPHLAEMLDVSQAYINMLLTGKKMFGKKQAARFNNLFGYSEAFLLTGKGNLYNDNEQSQNSTIPEVSTSGNTLNIANIDHRLNEMLAICHTLTDLIKQGQETLIKSQQQFDRVLNIFDRINNPSRSYYETMAAEANPEEIYNREKKTV